MLLIYHFPSIHPSILVMTLSCNPEAAGKEDERSSRKESTETLDPMVVKLDTAKTTKTEEEEEVLYSQRT
jgi:hypothetical protein